MTTIRNWYNSRSNAITAALRTFAWTFIAAFSTSLLGFLGDVADWAGSVDGAFPAVTPLGKAAVAALVAAVSGLVNYLVVKAQTAGRLPGDGPQYRLPPPAPPEFQ